MGRKLVPRERTEIINLEEFVPQDHLLRAIDRYLDLAEFRTHLKPFYSHIGRPSVDPELIIRMLSIGYCYGIRSRAVFKSVNGIPAVAEPTSGVAIADFPDAFGQCLIKRFPGAGFHAA